MSDPPDPYLGDILHPGDMIRWMSDLVDHLRIHPIQESSEDGLAGVPPDFEDDRVIRRPTSGSAKGNPNDTPNAPKRTARLPRPSVRA